MNDDQIARLKAALDKLEANTDALNAIRACVGAFALDMQNLQIQAAALTARVDELERALMFSAKAVA